MNIKYFDVVIDPNLNRFHIVESTEKPKNGHTTLEVLNTIKKIIEENIQYDASNNDAYSYLTQKELYETLKKRSLSLTTSNKTNFFKKFIDNTKEEKKVAEQIKEYVENDFTITLKKAKRLGYEGSHGPAADKYIKDFASEISSLFKQKVIPKEYFINSNHVANKITVTSLLDILEKITPDDMNKILLNEKLYAISNPKVAKILLRNTFDLGVKNNNGFTPLMLAAKARNEEFVNQLLASPVGLNRENANIDQALFYACYPQKTFINPKIIQTLLEQDANPNIIVDGFSPLHCVCEQFDSQVAKLLIAAGADINLPVKNNSVEQKKFITPLNYACSYGKDLYLNIKLNKNLVILLLDMGANIHGYEEKDGLPPLHNAAKIGSEEVVELLLSRGADVNRKFEGDTALIYACGGEDDHAIMQNDAVILKLIRNNASNEIGHLGSSPVDLIINRNFKKLQIDDLPLKMKEEFDRIETAKAFSTKNSNNYEQFDLNADK